MEIEPLGNGCDDEGVGLNWVIGMHTVIDTLENDHSEEAERSLREDLIRIGTILVDQSMIETAFGGTIPEVISTYRTFIAFMENRILG